MTPMTSEDADDDVRDADIDVRGPVTGQGQSDIPYRCGHGHGYPLRTRRVQLF